MPEIIFYSLLNEEMNMKQSTSTIKIVCKYVCTDKTQYSDLFDINRHIIGLFLFKASLHTSVS